MNGSDFSYVIHWYGVLFVIGISFFPITAALFSNFLDRGYLFSKVLGVIFLSYFMFILGIGHILSFTQKNILVLLGIVWICNGAFLFINHYRPRIKRIAFNIQPFWKLLIFEELLFFVCLYLWSLVRAFQPDLEGLEKYMDFGFVNSIVRAQYFPPKDMWFTPFSINYYYFGHLITALLTKLSGIPSWISYNLMIATLFAFTFTLSFSIGINLYRGLGKTKTRIFSGLLTAFLVACAGNFHTIYAFFKSYKDTPVPFFQLAFSPQTFPNSYWYPNATRFIYNTIHEFPLYSFIVSDLHGHVLSIPIVLTIIALLLNLFFDVKLKTAALFLFSFLIAIAYMTNAWDGIIYFMLIAITLLYFTLKQTSLEQKMKSEKVKSKNYRVKLDIFNTSYEFFVFDFLYLILILIVGFLLFSLPFSINFKPFVSGIGVLCMPEFLTRIGHIGPLLFEAQHCQKSPLWQLLILHGFFSIWTLVFLFKKKNWAKNDIFVVFLLLLSTFLIILPEFIYMKDIYPAHYRANTMFKLAYQAFIMLSLATGYIITKTITNFKLPRLAAKQAISNLRLSHLIGALLVFIGSIGLFLVSIYPYFAIFSYYGDLKTYRGLNGLNYLNALYSSDYQAIMWLNKHIQGQPVILEAQGDSYTNYARISSNTGLPTVLGWTVHEWLWRGSYDIPAPRITDVKTLYETESLTIAKKLISSYDISFIYIGDLERQKYPTLQEKKFEDLGKIVYQKGTTKIYKIL